MPNPIQRDSIAYPLTDRYQNSASAPTPGPVVTTKDMVPPTNKIPENYPIGHVPGKIESLYGANNRSILSRFSPKTPYTNGLLRFGPRQPFVWYNPNEGKSGLNSIKKYDSRAFPIGSTLQDVVRISKFSVSGPGVVFLIKQFLLQNLQSHNETALYNPLMPIVAALRPGSLGILPRPTRHIDLGGGLLGALASVVGFSVGDGGKSSPKGTVGEGIQDTNDNSPLSRQAAGAGKGLLRAKTASSGYTSLASRWGGNSKKNSFLKSMVASVFPSLISVKQPEDTGYRGDEGAYGMMVNDVKGKFKKHNPITDVEIPFTQIWIAGSSDGGKKNIRKKKETPKDRKLIFVDKSETKIDGSNVSGPNINTFPTGFDLVKDVDNVEKYGLSMGMVPYRLHNSDYFKYSVMLINYKKYIDKTIVFPTKMDGSKESVDITNVDDTVIIKPKKEFYKKYGFDEIPTIFKPSTLDKLPTRQGSGDPKRKAVNTDGTYSNLTKPTSPEDVRPSNISNLKKNLDTLSTENKIKIDSDSTDAGTRINTTLQNKQEDPLIKQQINNIQSVIDQIRASGYKVYWGNDNNTTNSRVLSSGSQTVYGLDKLKSENITPDKKYTGSYKDSHQLLDGFDKAGKRSQYNKKFSSTGLTDEINRLTILDKDKNISDETGVDNWKKYDPYQDDLIAFYFYDMVNEKHIPFRASITGINDSFQADWTNYEYLGRADKLYSYKGFSRTLNFSFRVIANSIKELLPMWKRVNYLCGLTMPADYTMANSQGGGSQNEFIVPPFVLLTVGDMYKEQPVLINRVALTIPEGSSWEMLSETNKGDWNYLNNIITWSGSQGKYAQFPREVDIGLDLTILQKERAITGAANFGHSVRNLTNESQIAGNDNYFSTQLMVPRTSTASKYA